LDRTAWTGQLGKDSWDRTAWKGQLGQDSWDRTAKTGKPGQENWDRKVRKTDGIVQLGRKQRQNGQNRQQGQDNLDGTTMAGERGYLGQATTKARR
jgi:hypothetical protein